MLSLRNFVIESMAISNVNDPQSLLSDIAQHDKLNKVQTMTLEELTGFARAIDPKADYVKSPQHADVLRKVLEQTNIGLGAVRQTDAATGADKPLAGPVAKIIKPEQRDWLAYLTYRAFMETKPFVVEPMNGIVGRALWLWVMGRELEKTFLATWHDHSLRFGGVVEVEKTSVR
jgi:hypothetical protein